MTRRLAPGLTRRTALGCAAFVLSPQTARAREVDAASRRITVLSHPLAGFDIRDRERRDFGALRFLGGLEMQSRDRDFGGLSGLRIAADGARFLAVTDAGRWIAGRIAATDGVPTALLDVTIAPMRGPDGRPLRAWRLQDVEGLSGADSVVFVGVERRNAVLRFDLRRDGLAARGAPIPIPDGLRTLPFNRGIEAIGVAPPAHPLAGRIVAIAERSSEEAPVTAGFILGGATPAAFAMARGDGYDVTDLDFLPSGDMLILERRFSLLRGIAMRIRRIAAQELKAGATLDGPVLIEADSGYEIDNMEALAVSRASDGGVLVTIMSDDNFSTAQRNLLLRFALVDR